MIYKLIPAFLFLYMNTNTIAQTKKEAEVAKAVEQLHNAMVSGNRDELEKITAKNLSYGHSSGLVENQAEFVDKIVSGKSDFVTINVTDQTISISGKTSIVRHRLHATTNDGGKPGEVRLMILLVFQNENKEWKLLARQAVKHAS